MFCRSILGFILIVIHNFLPFGFTNAQIKNYESGELIVQLRKFAVIDSVTKNYRPIDLKAAKLLSRRLNIWLVAFDTTAQSDEVVLSSVRVHPDIKLAQFNHFVEQRVLA